MPEPRKPPALAPDDAIRIVSPASPVEPERLHRGMDELSRLGFRPLVDRAAVLARCGYFAGPASARLAAFQAALREPGSHAVFCARGGYGSNYLLESGSPIAAGTRPKIFVGYSDCTSPQLFLWRNFGWVTFYGPMIAAGLDAGPGAPGGYDRESFRAALTQAELGWPLDLQGEALSPGSAEGVLLGGCLTLVQTAIGTPWQLEGSGAILLLEDRGMKPYQVDRALMHLKHSGQFRGVRGIILGDFPECHPAEGEESVREIARRILGDLRVPAVFGAPIGHTARPMLTLPLGVRARLSAGQGKTQLEVLEPACAPPER